MNLIGISPKNHNPVVQPEETDLSIQLFDHMGEGESCGATALNQEGRGFNSRWCREKISLT